MDLINFLVTLLQDPMGVIQGWIAQGPMVAVGLIFLVIFIETGVVVMPFLPGDSLLFAAGVLCHGAAGEVLPLWELLLCVWAAAILGDQSNFMIGHFLGRRIVDSGKIRALTPERIQESENFMAKWGGLSVFLGRFFPFIRTFVPFLAGMGGMRWHHFFGFNVLGGIVWSSLFTLLGYFFGTIPAVQEHFELVVVGIVAVSVVPAIVAAVKARMKSKRAAAQPEEVED
ncbi:VTT domain-containing protein [Olsenella sp. YH-ols2217]|uniref:VTT domain-containing protein n=1 Tax=Kribbibacterium absianum TaxID=3044210 RepID=A0ABT6ZJE6_9ACTN|nr:MULTISPECIES: VTT domain-containing protein [unclassified Olsenella]MDJ1122846.1 VTT domain-containing protein [Olsenella sp. YH-ols2216]MDJ1129171.1 VTT domain-containing protein [Olsenella sp. YH-ols2217]